MGKILINTPDKASKGGVAQYYKVMKLDEQVNIDYFSINNSVKSNVIFRLLSTYYAFFQAIKDYDIIGLNPSLDKKSFFRDSIFAFITKLRGKQLLVFWHGWENSYEDKLHHSMFLKNIFKYSFGKADGFLVLGDIFKQKLIRLGVRETIPFHRETMSISKDWIDTFNIEDKLSEKQDSNTLDLLFLSRIVKEKGVYICADAIKILTQKYPNKKITMHIAGNGEDLEALKTYAEQENIENIIFHGDVRGEMKYNLLRNADIFFFPTYYGEGFPNVIVEALFFGLPVVTRPIAAIPDIIIPKYNGYLDAGKTAKAFTPYLESYINLSSENKREMAKDCHKDALAKYKVEDIKLRTINYYNQF